MIDRRELILARLETLLASIDDAPAENVFRNRAVLPEDKRPAMVLLDGVEDVSLSGGPKSSRGPAAYFCTLRPQIFAVLQRREIPEAGQIGPELSQYRVAIMAAVMHDDDLLEIVETNGMIEYSGSETDMQTGSTMEGQLQMNFAFRYRLDPQELLT